MQCTVAILLLLTAAPACRLGDPTTPVPQPDTLLFGRVAAVHQVVGEGGVWEVEVTPGLPESLAGALRRDNQQVPRLPEGLGVKAKVDRDTLCVPGALVGDLSEFRVGQEVAIVPRTGSTSMVGTKVLLLDVAELYLFSTYQRRFLPGSLESIAPEAQGSADPARINSAGMERSPLPLKGGRVVYFAAGLLPPLPGQEEARGALREGMRNADESLAPWTAGGFRPYRVEWLSDGWQMPEPVLLPGLDEGSRARITWLSEEETSCLVEVESGGGLPPTLLQSRRASSKHPWGELMSVQVGGAAAGDAQRFGTQLGALVWTSYEAGSSDLWLTLEGVPAQPVEPRINTLGQEWAPRVGLDNVLFFCRGERQLVFSGGMVQEVRLPGEQRRPLLEAAPTADGELLFFRVPVFAAGGGDWDLAVARRDGDGWGASVALDDWRPQ